MFVVRAKSRASHLQLVVACHDCLGPLVVWQQGKQRRQHACPPRTPYHLTENYAVDQLFHPLAVVSTDLQKDDGAGGGRQGGRRGVLRIFLYMGSGCHWLVIAGLVPLTIHTTEKIKKIVKKVQRPSRRVQKVLGEGKITVKRAENIISSRQANPR